MKKVISDYQSGMTPQELGEKYCVNESTIRNRLIKKTNTIVDHIISDYESGMTLKEVGEKYGIIRIRHLESIIRQTLGLRDNLRC